MKIKDENVKKELLSIKESLTNAYKAYGNTPKDSHILTARGKVSTLINIIDWGEEDGR